MTAMLHAHVRTDSLDCDGPFSTWHDWVLPDAMSEDDFEEACLLGVVSSEPLQDIRIVRSADGVVTFTTHVETEEGYWSCEYRTCREHDIDEVGGWLISPFAERMGY